MFERAQAAGTSRAARLGHTFGEACQEKREPKPGGDLTRKDCHGVVCQETANEEHGAHDRSQLDYEHDRIGNEASRMEPAKRHLRSLYGE
jgi:hypothetical protein